MFDAAINELESMGIPYTENEDGSLAIDIADADKTDVVTIVSFLNDNGLDYTIDAQQIVVQPTGDMMEPEADDYDMEGEMATVPDDMEGVF